MSDKLDRELLYAIDTADFDGVKKAIDSGADIYVRDSYGFGLLGKIAGSTNPDTFAIVRCLVEHGANIDAEGGIALKKTVRSDNPDALAMTKYLVEHSGVNPYDEWVLKNATWSNNPDACAIIEYLIEKGMNIHLRSSEWGTALTTALIHRSDKTADYLLSRDDFALSDLIPRPRDLQAKIYKEYRKKAIAHVANSIELRGIAYAGTIAADVGKMLKNTNFKVTKEDIKALEPLAKKIASMDRVADARVTSDDFQTPEISR